MSSYSHCNDFIIHYYFMYTCIGPYKACTEGPLELDIGYVTLCVLNIIKFFEF